MKRFRFGTAIGPGRDPVLLRGRRRRRRRRRRWRRPPTGSVPPPPPPPTASACSLSARKDWAAAQLREWYLFPETLPANLNPAAYASVDDYIDALTATARAQRRDRFFTYPDLDRGGERLLQLRVERRLRHPLLLRHRSEPGLRRRSLRGRAGARGRDRPRHRAPRDRHQRRQSAAGQQPHGLGRPAGGQQRARAVDRGHDPGASDQQLLGHPRGHRHQGRLRADPRLEPLRRQDHRRRRPQGRLRQPAHLHQHRRRRRSAAPSRASRPRASPRSSSTSATMAAAWSRSPS